MRVLAVVHQPDAGPGVFAGAVRAGGHALDEWRPPDSGPPLLESYGAVLVLGGGMHADQEQRHPWLREEKKVLRGLLEAGTPLLGVCLGSQLVAEAAGGTPRRADRPEIGWHEVELTDEGLGDPLLAPLPPRFEAFAWHSYEFSLPPGAEPLARSATCLQGFRRGERVWGLQFHAEVEADSVESWLRKYQDDEDAVKAGVDPDRLRSATASRIEAWNAVGRGICERFLALADH